MTNPTIAYDHSGIDETVNHWRANSRGKHPPFRSDIGDKLAPTALLIERTADGRSIIRYAGYHFENLAGSLLSGRDLSALFVDYHRAKVDEVVEKSQKFGEVTQIDLGIDGKEFHLLLLPVRAENGDSDYILIASDIAVDFGVALQKITFVRSFVPNKWKASHEPLQKLAEDKAHFAHKPKQQFHVINGAGKSGGQGAQSLRSMRIVKREP